jgi:hypothetical protein
MMVDHTVMQLGFPTALRIRAPRLRMGRSTRRFLRVVMFLVLVVAIFLMNVQPVAACAPDWGFGVRGMLLHLPLIDAKWLYDWAPGYGYVKV